MDDILLTLRTARPSTVSGPFSLSSVALSPDRTHIVSGSNDKTTLGMHAPETLFLDHSKGTQFQSRPLHSLPMACASSDDQTIRVCTGDTVAGPFKGHTLGLVGCSSVTFSPDGWSHDETSEYEMHSPATLLLDRKLGLVGCILSRWQRIVSGSGDQTIQVWDGMTLSKDRFRFGLITMADAPNV